MKALALVAALLTTPTAPAPAQDAQQFCVSLGEIATRVMVMRQSEYLMSELMATVPEGAAADLFRDIIMSAYEQPSYSTPEHQQKAVQEFRNAWELQCYNAIAN